MFIVILIPFNISQDCLVIVSCFVLSVPKKLRIWYKTDKSDSLVQGIMPDVLKVMRVSPIDKGGHAADLSH